MNCRAAIMLACFALGAVARADDEAARDGSLASSRRVRGDVDGATYRVGQFMETAGAAEAEELATAESARQRPAPAPPAPPPADPAATAYKGVFFDNDFSYLDVPGAEVRYLGDVIKQIPVGAHWMADAGGEVRLRDHHEHDLRGSNLSGRSDDFLLDRTRLYVNLQCDDWLRFYGEALDGRSWFEDNAARNTEENHWDAQNLFVDGLLIDGTSGKLTGRVGRQELLYGAQRLVSPLDWANVRRTFDGAKLFWRGEDWNVDGFWVRPLPLDQHLIDVDAFNTPDGSQEFMGLYSTYKGIADHVFDFYYLRYAEYDAPGTPLFPVDFDANTFGTRWLGKRGDWLWEVEGGYQFGTYGALDQSAGFCTVGGGRLLADADWKPTAWIYYDWASGDPRRDDGEFGTFNQLFPLGHQYLGFMDLVGRQNIQDLNFLVTATPSPKTRLLLWYHIFHLDQARDALYNAGAIPIRLSPDGSAGTDVGEELDVLFSVLVNARIDVAFGYSHFWGGDFIQATNPPGVSGNADFYYSQWTWRF